MTTKPNTEDRSYSSQISQKTRDYLSAAPIGMVIDGKSTPASGGALSEVIYPATGEVVATVQHGAEEDAKRAIDSAHAVFQRATWSAVTPRRKGRILETLANLVEDDAQLFAELETLETGKPIKESLGDVARAVDGIRFYAACTQMCRGETINISSDFLSYTVKEPLGVVAAIVPWNVPLVLTVAKAAPALAMGNSVVVKPAKQTPLTALLLAHKAIEAGLPPGTLNVVTGSGAVVGNLLSTHPLVSGVTFTGSTETGRSVAAAAVASNKRMQLELGGKSANIIFADADLKAASREAAAAIFYGQGEICSAGSRLLVESSVFDQVLDGVAEHARKLRAGDPLNAATELGALISPAHLASVKTEVDDAVRAGAVIVAGGDKLDVPGFQGGAFMAPTILSGVTPEARVAQEEIFGPVLVALPFDSDEEAIEIANGTAFGLAAGVWTEDAARGRQVAGQLRSGVVWINAYNQFDPAMPFGGVKASGGGSREWSHLAIDSFSEIKSIWERS